MECFSPAFTSSRFVACILYYGHIPQTLLPKLLSPLFIFLFAIQSPFSYRPFIQSYLCGHREKMVRARFSDKISIKKNMTEISKTLLSTSMESINYLQYYHKNIFAISSAIRRFFMEIFMDMHIFLTRVLWPEEQQKEGALKKHSIHKNNNLSNIVRVWLWIAISV